MKSNANNEKSRQELVAEILKLKESLPELITAPKIFLTDTTAEGLQQALAENHERLSVISDEGNIFEIMAGLYTAGRSNNDVFLCGHAGGPLRVKRSGRSVHLNKIAVSFALAIQPQVLEGLKTSSKRDFRGKGLLARFLFCQPQSNIGYRDVCARVAVPKLVKTAYFMGITKLLQTPQRLDDQQVEQPILLTLAAPALSLWEQFSQKLETELGEGGRFQHQPDIAGKLAGAALRIAGLCHVAGNVVTLSALSPLSPWSPVDEVRNREISFATLQPILSLCEKLIVHAQILLDFLDAEDNMVDAKWALSWIMKHWEIDEKGAYYFRQNGLQRSSRFNKSKLERVTKALEILRERHVVSKQCKMETRKPTLIYYINPRVVSRAN